MVGRTILALGLCAAASAFAPAQTSIRPETAIFDHPINGGLPTFNPPSMDRAKASYSDTTAPNQASYVVTGDRSSELSYDPAAFPKNLPLQLIQGGSSRLTYKMPQGADRAQIFIQSNGRPLKARVELWLGPIRRVHFMDISCMNGSETPYRGCIKFKNTDSAGPQTIEISTSDDSAFPALVGPSPIADHSVQLLVWSKDVGKKSFKVNVEMLQGPNCKRQYYELQCGGGTQPYHAVFECPGNGWTMRWTNTKTLHDGSHEFVVVPYELEDDAPPESDAMAPFYGGYAERSGEFEPYADSLGPHGNRVYR
ncbi:LOW QUALITY PROTEIN: hypothetical protein ACHAXT_007828 [Thalassiosira profunda]